MTTLTLKYQGNGNFRALYPDKCANMAAGDIAAWQTVEVRSGKSHRHYFAAVHQAWLNLPEHLVDEFPSSEHLRKYALIKSGFCTMTKLACKTNADAINVCSLMSKMDTYAICEVTGGVVTVRQAYSQSIPAMGRKLFQESKEEVFRVLSEMIGAPVTEDMAEAA
jgi:hypothetical protein